MPVGVRLPPSLPKLYLYIPGKTGTGSKTSADMGDSHSDALIFLDGVIVTFDHHYKYEGFETLIEEAGKEK